MPLLIDCYNLLHTTMPPGLAGLDEDMLCRLLARSRWAGRSVIVCDGGTKPGLPESSPVEGVELIYAGKGRSADEEIIDRIDADSAPRKLMVVSSDREIQKAAKRRGASVYSSDEFVSELAKARFTQQHPAAGAAARDVTLTGGEVDRWIRAFGVTEQEAEPLPAPETTGAKPVETPREKPKDKPRETSKQVTREKGTADDVATQRDAAGEVDWTAGVTPLRNRKRGPAG